MSRLVIGAPGRRARRQSPPFAALGAVLVGTAMVAGLVATGVAPAYANVTSDRYTIGSPSRPVSDVTVAPSTVTKGAPTSFELVFYAAAAISGSEDGAITVTPSRALASPPTNVAVISGGCLQGGTAGARGSGASLPTSLVVDLASSCSIGAKAKVEVDFDASAPTGPGPIGFSFAVTTSAGTRPGISNEVSVTSSPLTLSARSYVLGANTTYSIEDVPVANLNGSDATVTLQVAATEGGGIISFVDGAAGYSVTVSGPSGTVPDKVTAVSVSGPAATLTLAEGLASGETIDVRATGSNPAASGTVDADHITVTPGDGTPETTTSIVFGGVVRGVRVSPQSLLAGVTTLYMVHFRASGGVAARGEILLQELGGPTNFTTVTDVLVIDSTAGWHLNAAATTLDDGSAAIEIPDAVNANDLVTVVLGNVTNPPAGTVRDFTISTSGDPIPADAAPYVVGRSADRGVVVSVEPKRPGAVAIYRISGLRAEATLQGGSSTIGLHGPSGTVFPANPRYYHVVGPAPSSRSATVSAGLSGGGTNDVTFTVPGTIKAGGVFSVTVNDVLNPAVAASTYSITLAGPVTGPVATRVRTPTPAKRRNPS